MPTSVKEKRKRRPLRGRRVGEPLYTLPQTNQGRFSLNTPYEVAFPDFHAALAQDCVGGGAVEIEVRHGEMQQILLTGQLQRVAGNGEGDLTALAAIDLVGLEALEVAQHGIDAAAQVGQGLFSVFWRLGDFAAGQA